VLAGFFRCHSVALLAVERCVETDRRDAELAWLEFEELSLRVVGAVEIADAGVIASNDEMRATVILARDGVENRLAWSGVAHGCGVQT
jgi:hypothetical protein